MRTPFEKKQKEFSDHAHFMCRDIIYPPLFSVRPGDIDYDVLPERVREDTDYYCGIDCFMDVTLGPFASSYQNGNLVVFRHTASYRFREAERFQNAQDVTFTTFNWASNEPGEIQKIIAEYFTYGYVDQTGNVVEVIIVDIPALKRAINDGKLDPTCERTNERSQQSFVTYSFENLKSLDLVYLHFKRPSMIGHNQKDELRAIYRGRKTTYPSPQKELSGSRRLF